MKPSFRLFPVLFLIGVLGTTLTVPGLFDSNHFAQAQSPVSNDLIPVSLPYLADVTTKDGTFTGKVAAFDPNTQTLKFSYSGGSRDIRIADIKSVVKFRQDAEVCCKTNGKVIIRGPDNSVATEPEWSGISLNAFHLLDPRKGLANVSLIGVISPIEIKEIWSWAQESIYVVEEIQFQPGGKMKIKVKLTDR